MQKPLKESIRVSSRRNAFERNRFINVKRFSRVPMAVFADESLDFIDHTAFALLAATACAGPIVSLGTRALGDLMGVSHITASRCIRKLLKAGHLEAINPENGKRGQYRLASPIFSSTAPEKPVRSAPVLNTCGRCGKRRRVNRTGYCDTCRIAVEVDRKMARWA